MLSGLSAWVEVRVRVGSVMSAVKASDVLLHPSLAFLHCFSCSVFFEFKSLFTEAPDTPRDLMWACRLTPRFNVLMLRNIFDGQDCGTLLSNCISLCFQPTNSFENVRRQPTEGWGLFPLCGIFNARRGEWKIFDVRRLGFKHLYSFLRSCGRRGEGFSVGGGVKVCISNAVEFNARMLGEGLYVRKTQCWCSKKKLEGGLEPCNLSATPITVLWLCSSCSCNAFLWSTSTISKYQKVLNRS